MFGLKSLFTKDNAEEVSKAPEIIGLRLNGAFELDDLKLKLIEPELVFEGAARTQFIQAVGEVKLDQTTTVLRFYTDDDGFIQILVNGSLDEQNIDDVKLWYFYQTQSVASQQEWDKVLNSVISQPHFELEGRRFERIWASAGDNSPPIAMTEKTYTDGDKKTQTDQFVMLYGRQVSADLDEFLLLAGEEKIIDNRADRCLVISTGINLRPADITIIG
ncbi:MAG: YjfK family protein [Methylococcales bacterium]|nr:YjfK family protein [Methylococcales bacterium]